MELWLKKFPIIHFQATCYSYNDKTTNKKFSPTNYKQNKKDKEQSIHAKKDLAW